MKAPASLAFLLCCFVGCDAPAPAPDATVKAVDAPAAPASEPTPSPTPSSTVDAKAAPASKRPAEDIARDEKRKPQEVMNFFEIAAGSRVAELQAGKGYYTELLAERVGTDGAVWAQNNTFVLDRFARGPLGERLTRMGAKHVQALESELDDPQLPSELDAVLIVLFYHDTYWQDVDRAKMNAAVFAALKPGGVYGVVDHYAEDGSGARDVESLHRVDIELVKKEITEAGFVLEASSELLRRPDDPRTENVFRMSERGITDRFVLRFRKPSAQPGESSPQPGG